MFEIASSLTFGTKDVLKTFDTFAEAKAYALENLPIWHFEIDDSVAYDAADFITTAGTIYSIQPARRA